MKRSGDRVIGTSGDRKRKLTAETRRRGEDPRQDLTTEARRHGEKEADKDRFERPFAFPTRQVSGHDFSRAVKRNNIWASAPAILKRATQILRAAVREIFDESAYDRFLLRTRAERSIESYRSFMRERGGAMTKRPRCC